MKIDIIGKGNLGSHLLKMLAKGNDVRSVDSRLLSDVSHDADLYILCVSDKAIAQVGEKVSKLIGTESVLVHTSGAVSISALENMHPHIGVFYPLQTFSKDSKIEYSKIPLFLEANDDLSKSILASLTENLGNTYQFISSENRGDIHIASVIANNFVNHLWTLADEYLSMKGLNFKCLLPLIKETCSKVERMSPENAQTGPACRMDENTLEQHRRSLENFPEISQIYDIITESIIRRNNIK